MTIKMQDKKGQVLAEIEFDQLKSLQPSIQDVNGTPLPFLIITYNDDSTYNVQLQSTGHIQTLITEIIQANKQKKNEFILILP